MVHKFLFAVGVGLLLLSSSAHAQQLMQFKVGDRVEIDVIMAGAPERSMYKKGTVAQAFTPGLIYEHQRDQSPI